MPNHELIAISPGYENRLPALFCEKVLALSSAKEVPEDIRIRDVALPMDFPGYEQMREEVFAELLTRAPEGTAEIIEKEHNTRTFLLHQYLTQQGIRSVPFFQTKANQRGQ